MLVFSGSVTDTEVSLKTGGYSLILLTDIVTGNVVLNVGSPLSLHVTSIAKTSRGLKRRSELTRMTPPELILKRLF